jgi:predicted RNA-binding protein with PUA-like domain
VTTSVRGVSGDAAAAAWPAIARRGSGIGRRARTSRPQHLQCKAMNWLVKEEPTHYGFDELVRDKKAIWSGVRNALAQKHLRAIHKGDRIFYYHTGDEKAVVGIAKAMSEPYPDPEDPSGKYVAVDVAPVTRLPRPVTLAQIKADTAFKDFALVRIGRLSVMPVTDAQWARIERMASQAPTRDR